MTGYYQEKLAAGKLVRCYQVATSRVKRYLEAELDFVLNKIEKNNILLDLGCGFGRIMPAMALNVRIVVGVDSSFSSLLLAQEKITDIPNCLLTAADAVELCFRTNFFDVVVCIQNGISAFQVDKKQLITECLRVTKPGGRILFSSYAEKFWTDRLRWFEIQAAEGLVGEIDYQKSDQGIIVCKDGFRATTVSPDQFLTLAADLGVKASINEVDESSVFCEFLK